LIKLIIKNSKCYKFGILVAIIGAQEKISSDYFLYKEKDLVLFSKYAETEINIEDTDYLILGTDDILCVIE